MSHAVLDYIPWDVRDLGTLLHMAVMICHELSMPLFHTSLFLPARFWARFVVLHTSSFMRIYLIVKIVWLFPPNYSVILFCPLGAIHDV